MTASNRPRVLFVGAFPPPHRQIFGGMVSSCRALLQSSFSTRVELDLLDSTQRSNPPPSLPARTLWAAWRFVRFVYRFERHRPAAVLLFAAPGASLVEKGVMARYSRWRGVPSLLFPRGGELMDVCRDSASTLRWVRVMLRGATKMLCQSATWQRFAVESIGFAPADAPIVPNWTATGELLAIGARRQPRNHGPVRLLFLGWLDRTKGVMELLEACAALAPRGDFTLDLAGEGNLSAQARALASEKGLDDVVRFRGWLRGTQLNDALAAADVLVLPSWMEGLPNAMIEAMAARLAVVVTPVGSVPDVVTDGSDALLVPPKDVEALRAALERVISDHSLRHALAAAGHATAIEKFSVEPAVQALIDAISDSVAAADATYVRTG